MQVDSQVVWTDDFHSSRCSIPRTSIPTIQMLAKIGLALGIAVGGLPILIALILWLVVSDAPRMLPLMFLGFFGLFCFPLAAFVLHRCLLILFGQKEIALDRKSLRLITRFGPLWSTNRCKLSDLGGFQIKDPNGSQIPIVKGRSSLMAVQTNGRNLPLLRMYPDEVIGQLATELPSKIQVITGRANAPGTKQIRAANLKTDVTSPDPAKVLQRTNKPIGSNLEIEQRRHELQITVPRLGIQKATTTGGRYLIGGFLLMQLVLTAGLLPALVLGKVEGDPAAGWLILLVFTAVTIGIVIYTIAAATRHGSIHIDKTTLSVQDNNLFSQHEAEWELAVIEKIQVGIEDYQSGQSTHWTHFFQVQPPEDEARQWFDNREKAELEWIVTCVKEELSKRD